VANGLDLKIAIVMPAATSRRTGNRRTASRYAAFLRADGHSVRVGERWDGRRADVLIALHARKSYESIVRYRAAHPHGALVLVLTGTDLYRDIRSDRDARSALDLADRLVVLQDMGVAELPARVRPRTRVVYQSTPAPRGAAKPIDRFRVAVIGHLRDEKDPFRAALALAHVPPDVAVEVVHIGDALDPAMAGEAHRLTGVDGRYRWLGGAPHARTLRWLASSHALVLASRMEGGANVICEAARAGVPVIASRVPGNVGMLGRDYPGYFPLGNERALARLIVRAARDTAFRHDLERSIRKRARLFTPESEHRGIARVVAEAVRRRGRPLEQPALRVAPRVDEGFHGPE
jgi:putative glycosyltransferase (TIGR04348 family)